MDRFLVFFQRYILSKHYIYMDLEFMLLDTFDSLRPKNFPKIESLSEANSACQRIRQAEAYQLNIVVNGSPANTAATETIHDVLTSYS